MTPQPDDHVRLLLGAYVLGHLAAGEAAAVRGHLDVCRTCRRDASELAPVADLLPLADSERIGTTDDPAPSREMLDEVLGRIERERNERDRSRRRSILARVTLVAAALAIVTVIAAVVSEPAEPAGGQFVAMVAVQAGVIGEAVVHEDPQSTWVELTTSGRWARVRAPRSAPSSASRATSTSSCTRPCLGNGPPRSASAHPTGTR